ncbi:MAG: type II toxin-antitoxin system RelE/ParE family toxin [Rhizobiaceae bacterium]|jgi:phage-related protein|nr:type II toxin-antitoxin system RelE/ParE family toxin [Rhizobiaceae bacterium]
MWVKAAAKDFAAFPIFVRDRVTSALVIAQSGGMADIAKPMKGFGPGVFEVALPWRGGTWRVVYAVRIGDDVWVVHAFQKKSTSGIATAKRDVDLIDSRLHQIREHLK